MFWFIVIASLVHFSAAAALYYFLCGGPTENAPPKEAAASEEPAQPPPPTVNEEVDDPADEASASGEAWLARLKEEGIEPRSMVEAATHLARLETNLYCERLAAIEVRLRNEEAEMAELTAISHEIGELITNRLAESEGTVEQIKQIVRPLDEPQELVDRLETVLLDEAAKVETARSNLANADDHETSSGFADQLLVEVGQLLTFAHTVRDGTLDVLLALASEGGLPSENLIHLAELEDLLRLLIDTDGAPAEVKPLVLAVVDIDQFSKINSTFGSALGDRVIHELESILASVVDAEEVRVTRRSGATYAVGFSGVEKDAAFGSLEQMCQRVAATSFDRNDVSVSLTASASLVERESNADPLNLLTRLDELVVEGRRTGPNRICVEDETGSSTFEISPGDCSANSVLLSA